jgi:hypothetical protein
MAIMAIEFNTAQYEASHGEKPRGSGGWAFAIVRNPKADQIFWARGLYAAAKKQARVYFAEARPFTIYLQP